MHTNTLRSMLLAAPILLLAAPALAEMVSRGAAPGVAGRLENGDPQLPEWQYYDTYTFEGTEGEALRFEVTSPDFLPGAILVDPNGAEVYQGLGVGNVWGRECRLTATGTWQIHVIQSFWEEGDYTLELFESDQSADIVRCDEW